MTALASALQAGAPLSELDLGGNRVTPVGAASLASALAAHRALTVLNLRGNPIGSAGAISIARALDRYGLHSLWK